MPIGFGQSILTASTGTGAVTQAATISGSNYTFTSSVSASLLASMTFQSVVVSSAFNTAMTATVYPSDSTFYLNSGSAWTIEFFLGHFVGAPSTSNVAGIFDLTDSLIGGFGNRPRIIQYSDGQPRFRLYNHNGYVSDTNYSADGKKHVALVSTGSGTLMWCINGSVSSASWSESTARRSFYFGQVGGNGANSYRVMFDELRVSNIARYSSSFTPTTVPFTTDENTLGLFHMNGNLNDSSI